MDGQAPVGWQRQGDRYRPARVRRLSIARSVQVALLGLTIALTAIAAVGVGALYASRQDYEDQLSAGLGLQAGAAQLLAAGVVEEATLRLTPGDRRAVARARTAYLRALGDLRARAAGDPRSATLVVRAGRAQERVRRRPRSRAAPLAARLPLAQLSDRQAGRIARARDDASDRARRAVVAIVAGGGLALLAALVLVAGLVAAVRRPLDELVRAAGRLAAGDGSARVAEGEGPPELRQLARAFNAMADDVEATRGRLEAERGRLATSVQALDDALVTTDARGVVEVANPRAAALVPEARAGAPFPEPAPRDAALAGEVLVERDGRTLAVTAAALGNGAGHVWTLRDVTERARLERMKRDFVATASHELRSPLTSIKGFVELLDASHGLSPRQQEWIGIVRVSTDRLVELVDDLLDVTRLEAGQVQVQRRLTRVDELVAEVARLLAPRIAAEGQELVLDVPEGLPRAILDPGRIRQVLLNLLTNAHLYTGPGGRLGIALRADGDALELRVSDTGRGMDADTLAHAFDRFHRGQEHGTVPGTGLGLSIVRSLVELHRGSVEAASEPGAGTTFTVRLPRVLERATTAPGAAVRAALPGKQVLLVAPEPGLATLLDGFGVLTEHAPGRTEAALALAGRRFDAVVLDVAAAGVGGLEVLRRLRADPRLRRVPVVLVSDGALREALAGEWLVAPPVEADALADALGAAIAADRIRVLAVGEPGARADLDAALDELGIAHEWAADAADVAAMCAARHYEVALLDGALAAPADAFEALDLRGRRLRRAVLVVTARPDAGGLDAEPVALADVGPAVLGLLAPDVADATAG